MLHVMTTYLKAMHDSCMHVSTDHLLCQCQQIVNMSSAPISEGLVNTSRSIYINHLNK